MRKGARKVHLSIILLSSCVSHYVPCSHSWLHLSLDTATVLFFTRLLTRWGSVKQSKAKQHKWRHNKTRGRVNSSIQEKRPTCVKGLFDRSSKAFCCWCQSWSSGRRSQLFTGRSFKFLHPLATHDQYNSIVPCTKCFIDDTAVSKWGKRRYNTTVKRVKRARKSSGKVFSWSNGLFINWSWKLTKNQMECKKIKTLERANTAAQVTVERVHFHRTSTVHASWEVGCMH